ncbi:MAG: radical SAM protein [Candidatus Rokuibacteriota bacterium]|nr:MAG: radical SAM protein [Candidatus Rokubacteria bacterium]
MARDHRNAHALDSIVRARSFGRPIIRLMRAEYREEPCKTALNRVSNMPFKWSLNPYTGCAHRCTFCYVRGFERRADRPSDDRYGRAIRVKINVAEVLRRELGRASWKRELVAIGAATDPYQPAEGQYRLTRACLEALGAARTPLSLVTRGPMVVRDIDVLTDAARRAEVDVNLSIPTLDLEVWRRTEPGTAPPRARLRALKALVDAGIRAAVGLAPILPGLSDGPEQLAEVIRAARDAGATSVWCNLLYLQPGTREHFLENLARDWPEQLASYEHLYRGPFLERKVSEPIRARVAELRSRYGIADRRAVRLEPEPTPEQLPLAM